jgi:hypothetical protein
VQIVRLAALLALSAVLVAGCGDSSSDSSQEHPSFAGVHERTKAAGPARFRMLISINAGGTRITAEERGTTSFAARRAHLFKQLPGGQFPQELVVIGPYTYTNANVQAALADPSVRPWTKLDTRKLTPKQRHDQPDELAHVQAPAYLPAGVSAPTYGGKESDGTFRFSGRVDPKRLTGRAAPAVLTALANDYPGKTFPATFWLDEEGRLRRVLVRYSTPQGTKLTLDTTYSDFGRKVDVTLPAANKIKDISP